MTFFGVALIAAIATVVLAVFAVVTAWYARKAFREQAREVAAIEQQVKDEQEVTGQQAELLKVQSEQLELQRQQLEDQRAASARQAEVLDLQATELRESLEERKREAEQRRRGQAVQVYFWVSVSRTVEDDGETHATALIAHVRNASLQPIYEVSFIWRVRNTLDVSQVYEESYRGEPLVPGDDATESVPLTADTRGLSVTVHFRDRAGVWWRAERNGFLAENSPPPGALQQETARLHQE